ncbi:MAG: HNH endonuclease [Gallionella sp.]
MLTQTRLKQLLDYNPETGVFTRRVVISNRTKVGDVAGTLNAKGYIIIRVDGKQYLAHRLAWLCAQGEFPPNEIDHINGIKTDNRICNLRAATRSENAMNQNMNARNTSGFKGVSWSKLRQKWYAHCQVNGKKHYLGCFDTAEKASAIYEQFATIRHGEFYCNILMT